MSTAEWVKNNQGKVLDISVVYRYEMLNLALAMLLLEDEDATARVRLIEDFFRNLPKHCVICMDELKTVYDVGACVVALAIDEGNNGTKSGITGGICAECAKDEDDDQLMRAAFHNSGADLLPIDPHKTVQ